MQAVSFCCAGSGCGVASRGLVDELQGVPCAQVRLDRGDVIGIAGKHQHARIGEVLGVALDRLEDRLQKPLRPSVVVTISVGAAIRDGPVSSSMSIRADEAPNAERCAVLPMWSSAHHRICASDAALPSRARMVSAAHCRTPLRRIASALPVPLPRTGDPNGPGRQGDRLFAAELHAGRSAVLLCRSGGRIRCQGHRESARCRLPSSSAGPAVVRTAQDEAPKPGRSGRTTRNRAAEMRYPAVPRARKIPGIAVDHHDRLGRESTARRTSGPRRPCRGRAGFRWWAWRFPPGAL